MGNMDEALTTSKKTISKLSTDIYLGCGKVIRLEKDCNIFMPSAAGIFFWETLRSRFFLNARKSIKILELGTGSGFFSFALAAHGFTNIIATDINSDHIDYAKDMWLLNKKINSIDVDIEFRISNLFENIPEDNFDVIVFNAPGWGTPHESHISRLKKISGNQYYSMFEGDKTVKKSLNIGLGKLNSNGSYFLGLNSICGISEMMSSLVGGMGVDTIDTSDYATSLGFTMLPLLLYNDSWVDYKNLLLDQFDLWKRNRGGYYQVKDGVINWVYDVIEVKNILGFS